MTSLFDELRSQAAKRYLAHLVCGIAALATTTCLSSCASGVANGAPVRGGTLHMLGSGDVDYMDPNVSYYTTGYLALRLWSRQLLTYPAVPGKTTTVVPDLATQVPSQSNGGISADRLTYRLTIRRGAMWNTSPPRQVAALDVIRGVERTCNPAQPFGGLSDFESLISGLRSFCDAFAKVSPTVTAIRSFLATNSISGVRADRSNPRTVLFTLTRPSGYFPYLLAMPALSPAPVELLGYLPGSADLAQHTISDGPYEINSYVPAKSITFVRNPAWRSVTDQVRRAYVSRVQVTETLNQSQVAQKLVTNSPGADMGWDAPIPAGSVPALLAAKRSQLTLGSTYGLDPFLLFNTASPNNSAALQKRAVRQALEYAIDRSALVRDEGGPEVAPPLTHVLPPGILGSKDFDPYPHDPGRTKQMLRKAGVKRIRIKVLYQTSMDSETKMLRTLQSDLSKVGVSVTGVPASPTDFYTKFLEVASVARSGGWDVAISQWLPDWYGDAAYSFFYPLFSGTTVFPPAGSNFGLYNSAKTNQLIKQAATARSTSQSQDLWAKADQQVMSDAVIFPIASPADPVFRGSKVHNAVFIPNLFQYDPTNVWLTPANNRA